MAVIVDQKRLGGGSHSTVGTITDVYTLLRLLSPRVGKPHVGYSNAFSFNDSQGMCRDCNGLDKKLGVVSDDFIDISKSLAEGAIQVPFWVSGRQAPTQPRASSTNTRDCRVHERGDGPAALQQAAEGQNAVPRQ
jgi:excinuclease UvrABC ATPase subunit